MVVAPFWPRIRTGYTLEARNASIRERLSLFDLFFTTGTRPSARDGSRRAASATNRSTCAWRKRLVPNWRIGLFIVYSVVSALDQCLDHSSRRVEQFGKFGRQVAQLERVRVQRGRRNKARTHGFQHGFEVFRCGIAAREQRSFTFMKLGIG